MRQRCRRRAHRAGKSASARFGAARSVPLSSLDSTANVRAEGQQRAGEDDARKHDRNLDRRKRLHVGARTGFSLRAGPQRVAERREGCE